MTQEKIVEYLEAVRLSQSNNLNRNESAHRCPACGKTLDDSNWQFSNAFHGVRICPDCKTHDLGNPTPEACAEMLKSWWFIQIFDKYGSFPTDFHFQVMDPEVNDNKTVTFLCECWFDWSKFGLDPAIYKDDDTWINVYLTVNPATNELFMEYTIDDNDKNESFVFVLNAEDRAAMLAVIDNYCKQHGETLQDIVDSIPMAEQEFEIPVKEINYGVAKIRATSLEEALKKVYEAYGTGDIEWGKTDFDFTVPTGGADNA